MKHRGRIKILFLPAVLVAAMIALIQSMKQDEGPEHNGRTLYRWMKDLPPYTGPARSVPIASLVRSNRTGAVVVTQIGQQMVLSGSAAAPPPVVSGEDQRRAIAAIYEIGTNAIPFLVTYYFQNQPDKPSNPS